MLLPRLAAGLLPMLVMEGVVLAAEFPLPLGCEMIGDPDQTATQLLVPEGGKVRLKGDVPESETCLIFKGKVGKGGNAGIVYIDVIDGEGKGAKVALRTFDLTFKGKTYPNNTLQIGWLSGKPGWGSWHFRPNPDLYRAAEWEKREAEWATLPNAAESTFQIEFRPTDNGEVEVWIQDQLMQIFELGTPRRYEITLSSGAVMDALRFVAPSATGELPVEGMPRPGALGKAKISFDQGVSLPDGLKGYEGASREGISVGGLGAFSAWNSSDLQSYFWRRHASFGLPEQRMFSVPLKAYSHAWVLCASEGLPDREEELILRVTRYGNTRGTAVADTLLRLPLDGKETADAKRVGKVTAESGGAPREVPLWLVRVPIRNGQIQDVLYDDTKRAGGVGTHRYLDVELMDPLQNVDESLAFPPSLKALNRQWKPTNPEMKDYDIYPSALPPRTSNLTVFGMCLEESPAEIRLASEPEIKAFYAAEKPSFVADIKARQAGEYQVEWSVADVDGKVIDQKTEKVKLAEGASAQVRFTVKPDIGWFAVQARLIAPGGKELTVTPSSYAMLPPDTRKAGYESPFYGWWFGKNHGSPLTLEQGGTLLQRLGMRRAELTEEHPESETAKYGFTNSTVNWFGGLVAVRDMVEKKKTLEEALVFHEAHIRKHLELWPSIDRMLVFHESGPRGAAFPTEIYGVSAVNQAVVVDENSPEALLRREGEVTPAQAAAKVEWQKWWPARLEYLHAMAKMVREKFPQLKMQVGNDGNSLALVGELFRQKYPREYIDTISIEDLGQTMMPENPRIGGLQSAWYLRELSRKMGYGDVPVTACTEWIGRMTERLGAQQQAEWKVRDSLLGLAYGFDTLSVGGLNDAGDGYYYSIWGNGGLTGRWPELAPKPSYAAIAALTQVVDSAKFTRWVPSESTVFYAQEFQRGDEWIYAFWTPRGTREAKVNFTTADKRTVIDLFGREKQVDQATVDLTVSPGPQYLISKEQLTRITLGASAFPGEEAPKEVDTEIPFETAGDVEVIDSPFLEDLGKRDAGRMPRYRQAKAIVREVNDPEMGACLEVEVIREGEVWDMEHEYVALKLATPVKTDAKNAGIWVKGNGAFGTIDISKTQGWGPWASNINNMHMRWSAQQMLNFDGWNFVKYPFYDWIRPIDNSVTGVVIAFPRKVLVGSEIQPSPNPKVRIKKIVLY